MTPVDFRVALAKLNVSHSRMAELLRVSPATVSNWARGERKMPYTAEVVINQMLAAAEGGIEHADTAQRESAE